MFSYKTQKTSRENYNLKEMQQLPDIEKTDWKDKFSSLKWTIHNDTRKVYVNYQTDTDKGIIAVYSYWNNVNLEVSEMELKMTKDKKLPSKRAYLRSYIDVLFKPCIVWMKQLFLKEKQIVNKSCSFVKKRFLIVFQIEIVIWTP